MSLVDIERLREIAEVEFADIVVEAFSPGIKELRIPRRRWEAVTTFPCHFHNGSETNVSESYLSAVPEEALRDFSPLCGLRWKPQPVVLHDPATTFPGGLYIDPW